MITPLSRANSTSVEQIQAAVSSPVALRMTFNCSRCGRNFQSMGARICPGCMALKAAGDPKEVLGQALSFREKQVVDLVCQGKANKEIGYELHLTEGTIKEYLNRIFRKTGVSNRTALAMWSVTRPAA